jgi:hypothetical protein
LLVTDALEPPERTTRMASGGKKKTTMAKLNREARLRERRQEKQARKQARREASLHSASQPADAIAAQAHLQEHGEPSTR